MAVFSSRPALVSASLLPTPPFLILYSELKYSICSLSPLMTSRAFMSASKQVVFIEPFPLQMQLWAYLSLKVATFLTSSLAQRLGTNTPRKQELVSESKDFY